MTTDEFRSLLKTNRRAAIEHLVSRVWTNMNEDAAFDDLMAVNTGDVRPFHEMTDGELVAEWEEAEEYEDEGEAPGVYKVTYRIKAAGGGTVVERTLLVPADTEEAARAAVVKFAEDHDPYHDDRIDPVVIIDEVEESDEEVTEITEKDS